MIFCITVKISVVYLISILSHPVFDKNIKDLVKKAYFFEYLVVFCFF